jgi:outer membrane lipoprotein-sorting protein
MRAKRPIFADLAALTPGPSPASGRGEARLGRTIRRATTISTFLKIQTRLTMEWWIVGACCLLALPEGDAAQEFDRAMESIRHQEENFQSFTLKYTYKDRQHNFVDLQREDIAEGTVLLMRDGVQCRFEEDLAAGSFDPKSEGYCIRTFNGEKLSTYTPSAHSGSIQSKPPLRFGSTFFDYLHGFKEGIAATLQENRENLRATMVTVDEESLLLIEFTAQDKNEVRLWLNPQAAYQIRRLETKSPKQDNRALGTFIPTRKTEVSSYMKKGDLFFPSEFVTTWTSVFQDGTARTSNEMHVRVLNIEPNAKHAADVFEIDFPKGTRVVDADAHTVSIVGQPGSTKPISAIDGDALLAQKQLEEQFLWRVLGAGICFVVISYLAYALWRRKRAR